MRRLDPYQRLDHRRTGDLLVMLLIGRQKPYIVSHSMNALVFVLINNLLYLVYYAFGWLYSVGTAWRDRVSYTLGSGVNNTAIVIVLAYLYFPPSVSVFLVTSEIAWVTGMVLFKAFIQRRAVAS